MQSLVKCYSKIVSEENLWQGWSEFRRGKQHRIEVRIFHYNLERELLRLRSELTTGTYRHGGYHTFIVHDPKRREINVPGVRDQVVHQSVWNILFPFFNRRFSSAVYSCRPGRGIHGATLRIQKIARRLSPKCVFVAHLDIVKFFDSIDHARLNELLRMCVHCDETRTLLSKIIASYHARFCFPDDQTIKPRGIPLGNLTSQLFANVMLMPFDRFLESQGMLHQYVRYADDCLVIDNDRGRLENLTKQMEAFLSSLGFRCRSRVTRFEGFETLGKRFFVNGMAIRRNTRRNALRKLKDRSMEFMTGTCSARSLNATAESLQGLSLQGNDPRWQYSILGVLRENTVGIEL